MNMGLTAENLARSTASAAAEAGRIRPRSHRLAAEATDSGPFAKEIVPTWGRDEEGRARSLTEDQCIRRDTSWRRWRLKPAFMPEGGTVTAGNAQPAQRRRAAAC